MKPIFIVTSGSYSDYRINAVFKNKEKAERYAKAFGGDIEEYEPNPFDKQLSKGYYPYQVHMNREGSTEKYGVNCGDGKSNCNWFANNYEHAEIYLVANMWAKNETHAIKIANERRTWCIANNTWGNELNKIFSV